MKKWSLVVPSNRPEQLRQFLEAWDDLLKLHNVEVFVVHDDEKHWKDIPEFIPRRTDMIRSWGMYQAYKSGADYILTLDDDTRPIGDIFWEYEQEFIMGRPVSNYFSVGSLTDSMLEMRGFPYKDRKSKEVAVQYGGWDGVMDFDAPTQLSWNVSEDGKFDRVNIPVPKGVPTTCCIMNTAWKREYTPIMWQLPMYEGKFNRFGDIWSGLFIKKTLDALDKAMVINGKASIRHERASNPFKNLEREQPGIEPNEGLWGALHASGDNMIDIYRNVTNGAAAYLGLFDKEYAKHFIESRDKWLELF